MTANASSSLSIAVVCDDGREYYAAVDGYDRSAATPWIAENVLPNLPPPGDELWKITRADPR